MLIGIGGFIAVFIVVSVAIVLFALGEDEFATEDIGDSLEKANEVAAYADARLRAAANSEALPRPPTILANQRHLQFALVITFVSQVFIAALAVLASRQGLAGFARTVGMGDVNFGRVWLIAGTVIAAYVLVYLYSLAAAATGISWLEPESTVPPGVTRDGLTMGITGFVTLVGAPISEEMFFRGLVFSGLCRWGFWPAALASGGLFSLVHFDPGSFLPFVGIGVLICWVYWRRGSLWDAIAFHFIFNATSFSIMVAIS